MSKLREAMASRLREARKAAGFEDAADAARRYRWPLVAYRSHENGLRGLKPDVALKYAKAYGVSFSWLVTGEGVMKEPGIDAQLVELPETVSKDVIEQINGILKMARIVGRIPRKD